MDVSVVAAVGSFAISERVLKPKATALFILGCILAYDLTTKTHDITSLRVYRGKTRHIATTVVTYLVPILPQMFECVTDDQVLRCWHLRS
jgi:hypothetical protein